MPKLPEQTPLQSISMSLGSLFEKVAESARGLIEAAAPHAITWEWVKGHNGHPENERVDRLASDAADSARA